MLVNPTFGAQFLATQSAGADAIGSGNFLDALEASKKKYAQQPPATDAKPVGKTAYDELQEYIKKGPIAHLRDKILKEMGLTEESLAAKSPKERSALEEAIGKKIKEYMLAHKGSQQPDPSTGTSAALAIG